MHHMNNIEMLIFCVSSTAVILSMIAIAIGLDNSDRLRGRWPTNKESD